MGLFSWARDLIKPKQRNQTNSRIVDALVPNFSVLNTWSDSDIYNTAVNCCVAHCSKFTFIPKVKDKETGLIENNPDPRFYELFTLRPNFLQSKTDFLSQTAKYYFDLNVAVIFVHKSIDGYPINMWNVNPQTAERFVLENGEVWYKFNIPGVGNFQRPVSDLIIIQRNINYQSIFSSDNSIKKVLDVINTNDDGIRAAIESSAFIRFIVETTTALGEQQKKDKAKAFYDAWLADKKDSVGVIYTDVANKITQITSNAKYESPADMESEYKRVYAYFGINSAVANNDYTETQFQAAYESAFEPFAIKLAEAFNWNIYDQNERTRGNKIIIDNSNLTSMSNASKREVAKILTAMPTVIPNMVFKVLGLPETDWGKNPYYTFGSNGAVNQSEGEDDKQ